jgi:hypothetical protein
MQQLAECMQPIGRVLGMIGRVPASVGRVHAKVGQVPITTGKRRGEIATEYHTCLNPYRAEPNTSDIFHRWIGHVRWTET